MFQNIFKLLQGYCLKITTQHSLSFVMLSTRQLEDHPHNFVFLFVSTLLFQIVYVCKEYNSTS